MIESKSKDDLEKEFCDLSDEDKKDVVKELLSFTVAPGIFGETTVTNSAGTVVSRETIAEVNMKMDSVTLIKLITASRSNSLSANRCLD